MARRTQTYACGATVTAGAILTALRWIEPKRDTAAVWRIAQQRLARGQEVRCVGSGRKLAAGARDIDHCLP